MEIDEVLEFEKPQTLKFNKEVWGWAIYDLANTIFSMNILTLYFAAWLIIDKHKEDIWYSISFSLAMLFCAVSMPVLGAISDAKGNKKKYLIILTLGCVLATFFIGLVTNINLTKSTEIILALIFFVIAVYCYEGGLVFYNALLPQVAPAKKIGQVSGLGVALGYIGAIIGMLLVLPFVQGKIFSDPGKQQAFIPTAIFFLLFCLPTFLWVKKDRVEGQSKIKIKKAFQEVREGLANTKKYPGVLRFLVSDFLFEDAIATVILFMAVYAQRVMGFSDIAKTWLFAISTTSAALGSWLCGWVCDKFGPKKSLSIVVLGWIISLLLVIFNNNLILFWILGSFIGIFLGSTWTVSRPLLAGLVTKDKMGQFFGLYSLSGRTAAILGPLIWGVMVLYFKKDFILVEKSVYFLKLLGFNFSETVLNTIQYRFAVWALVMVMLLGWLIYLKVPDKFVRSKSKVR